MFDTMINYFLIFAVWILLMYQTSVMAEQKGYNKKLATFMGAIFFFFAFIIYWSLPDKTVKKKK